MNLLKNKILIALTSATLVACGGGVDDGFDPERTGDNLNLQAAGVYEFPEVNDIKDESDVSNRYVRFDLFEGISDLGGIDPDKIFIRHDGVYNTSVVVRAELNEDGNNFVIPNNSRAIKVDGHTVTLDMFRFNQLVSDAEYDLDVRMTYWVDNGYEFSCENSQNFPQRCTEEEMQNNPNLRTVQFNIRGDFVDADGFTLSDTTISAGKTSTATTGSTPEKGAPINNADFTWSIVDGTGTATVDVNGVITGGIAGTATLVAEHPTFGRQESALTILNDIFITDSTGEIIGDSINVASCGSIELTPKAVESITSSLPGSVNFSSTVSDIALGKSVKLVTTDAAMGGNAQPHRISVLGGNAGDTFNVEFDLADYTGSDDLVNVTVNVIDNLVCSSPSDSYYYNMNFDDSSRWSAVNSTNMTMAYVANSLNDDAAGTGDEGYGNALSLTYNYDVAPTANGIITLPGDASAEGGPVELFNDATKTWKVAFDARVVASDITGAGYALRFENDVAGNFTVVDNYVISQGYIPVNNNEWQNVSVDVAGFNHADIAAATKRIRFYLWKGNHGSFPNAAITTVEIDNLSVTEVTN